MSKRGHREHRYASVYGTQKKDLVVVQQQKPFYVKIPARTLPTGAMIPAHTCFDTLIRPVREKHRDGRIHTVIRGHDMRLKREYQRRLLKYGTFA